MSHTPGPWTAKRWHDARSGTYGWSLEAGGHSLPLSEMETDNPDECDANARLIATAPELLASLRHTVRFWDQLNTNDTETMRALIARATGETT